MKSNDAMWWNYRPGQPLEEVVKQAADHYRTKYGAEPTLCQVRVCAFEDVPEEVNGIPITENVNLTAFHVAISSEDR